MKIAILGDTHFGVRNDNLQFHSFYRRFYTNIFFPYLKQHGIKQIIQLGDLFDRRKYINFNSLYQSRDYFFDVIETLKYKLDVFPGNHDIFHKNTLEVNSLDLLLGEYSNINIIRKSKEVSYENTDIALVPWICDDNEDETLNFLDKTKAKICMGHFEIQGFEMHKGHICETGFDRSAFHKFDLTLSGHYHTRSHKEGITYVGTPYEMTWSDYNDDKGFHILDTETLDLTFVQNPYKMFHKVSYNDTNWKNQDHINGFDFSDLEGAYVKVIVSEKTNPYWFDLFIDKIEKASPTHIQIVDETLRLDVEDDGIVDESEDTVSILGKYVDALDADIDKVMLMDIVRNLYADALNS